MFMALKTALETWMRRVWVEQDSAAIMELMAEHALVHGLEENPFDGREAFRQFHELIAAQLRDIEVEFLQVVEDGEWIAAVFEISSTHIQTELRTTTRGHMMSHFIDGQIVEGYNQIDFVKHFEQLGVLPNRTLDLCWLGQRPRFQWEAIVKKMN